MLKINSMHAPRCLMKMLPDPENTALGSFVGEQVLAEASMARTPESLPGSPLEQHFVLS